VSVYNCPYTTGGCRFQLTRMEMKEGVKVLEHLKSEHQVTNEDIAAAVKTKNQKYKFTKCSAQQ